MSAYTTFVRANIDKMPGRTPQERMKQVAAKWRQMGHQTAARRYK